MRTYGNVAKNKAPLKWIGYCRRSIEQSGNEERVTSIEDQIQELNKIAEREGIEFIKIFSEAKTGSKAGVRKEYTEMVKMIKSGKANAVACWKINRLFRNFLEGGEIIDLLQNGIIKEIKTSERSYTPEENIMMLSVEMGMARQYVKDLTVDVKRGLYGQAERGYRPTGAPVGYLNSRYHQRGKDEEILIDKERFPLIRKLFDLMLTNKYSTHALFKIAKNELTLTTSKGGSISKSQMYQILINPFYYGEFEYPRGSGKWYQGNHEPIITREEYDRIQILLRAKGRPRPQTKTFAYTGLIKCAICGSNVTAERKNKIQKNGNVHQYTYYICTRSCNHSCIAKAGNEKSIDADIVDILKRIEIPRSFHEWAIETLKEMHADEKKDRNSMLFGKQKEYDDVVARLDSLLDLKLDNKISDEDYSRKKNELDAKKHHLNAFLKNIDGRIDDWLKEAECVLDFAEKASLKFESATTEEKRSILSSLSQNLALKDGKVIIEITNPLKLIESSVSEVKKISNIIEPLKPNLAKAIFAKSKKLSAR